MQSKIKAIEGVTFGEQFLNAVHHTCMRFFAGLGYMKKIDINCTILLLQKLVICAIL